MAEVVVKGCSCDRYFTWAGRETAIPLGMKFCPFCGDKLSEPEEPLSKRELKRLRELLKRACL